MNPIEASKLPILIVGTGLEARVALEIANSLDILVYGFMTTDEQKVLEEVNHISVISLLESEDGIGLLKGESVNVVIAEPDGVKRKELVKAVRHYEPAITGMVHPLSAVSQDAKIGNGNLINAGCVINPNVFLGSFNVIHSCVSIEPDCIIGDYGNYQAGARIGREVEIGDQVYIGMGAVIHPGVHIADGAIIGPGAVVLSNVPEKATAVGNPAVISKAE